MPDLEPARLRTQMKRSVLWCAFGLLAIRLLLPILWSVQFHLPLESIFLGHDGAEYAAFSRAIAQWNWAAVPAEARRHHPGWPLVMVPGVWLGIPGAWGVIVGCCASFSAAAILAHWHARIWSEPAPLMSFSVLFAYPPIIYYGCFALSEPLFTLLLVIGCVVWARGTMAAIVTKERPDIGEIVSSTLQTGTCFSAVCLVRGPGLMFAGGVALAGIVLLPRRWWLQLWLLMPVAVYVLMNILLKAAWGASTATVMEPIFGFPFCGFWGIRQVSIVRAAYMFAMLAAVLLLLGVALVGWSRQRATMGKISSAEPVTYWDIARIGAVPGVLCFIGFHLCIHSLKYYGDAISPFNYYDRYYAPVVPLLLLSVPLRYFRGTILIPFAVVSLALALWWGQGYWKDVLKAPPGGALIRSI